MIYRGEGQNGIRTSHGELMAPPEALSVQSLPSSCLGFSTVIRAIQEAPASGAVFSFSGEVSENQAQGDVLALSASRGGCLEGIDLRADRLGVPFSGESRLAASFAPVLPDRVLSVMNMMCWMTGDRP